MRPSKTSAVALAGAAARGGFGNNSSKKHTTRQRCNGQTNRPYEVLIKFFGRVEPWNRFCTAGEADAEVAQLKGKGFDAERVTR